MKSKKCDELMLEIGSFDMSDYTESLKPPMAK